MCIRDRPLDFKGSALCKLYKNKGLTELLESWRGIHVEGHVGKTYHKSLRRKLLPYYERNRGPTQCRGAKHMATDYANITLRAALWSARKRTACCAALFIDVWGAFDRTFREAVLGYEPGEDDDDLSVGWLYKVSRQFKLCLLYTSPSPRDATLSRMPSSA